MDAGEEPLHQKFRFGPLFRASYSSLTLVSTNLRRVQAPEIGEAPTASCLPKIISVSRAKPRDSDRGSLAHVADFYIPTIPASSTGPRGSLGQHHPDVKRLSNSSPILRCFGRFER